MNATVYPYLGRSGRLCQNDLMAKKKSTRTRANQIDESEGIDFEDALADVECIVARLESGETGLGESLELYEAGVKRLKECHALLHAAERQISLLSGFDADGNPITEPMEDASDETLEEKQKARRKRRRSAAPQSDDNGADSLTEDADSPSSTVDDSPGLF